MMVIELINEYLLPLGTKLTLVHSSNPRQKLNRPRVLVGVSYNAKRLGFDTRDGLYLRRPNGEFCWQRWPKNHNIEMTDKGFVFYDAKGKPYVGYDFVHETIDDGLDL